MRLRSAIAIATPLVALAVAGAIHAGEMDGASATGGSGGEPSTAAARRHDLPESRDGNLVVGLCDGETSLEVKGVKQGETMDRARAQAVSDALMAEWRRKNPDARWDDEPARLAQAPDEPVRLAQAPAALPNQPATRDAAEADGRRAGEPAAGGEPDGRTDTAPPAGAPAPGLPPGAEKGAGNVPIPASEPPAAGDRVQTGIYSAFTDRDQKVWMVATDTFVTDGNKVFHDAKALGGTIGVSCDMCHPDASNTHPETYPKYQVQLGRVALLRDMINWCIENPVRGKPLPDGDVKMKALEAYIIAQRKGVALDYGKH
jgi:thiosulfate dehydrogenase